MPGPVNLRVEVRSAVLGDLVHSMNIVCRRAKHFGSALRGSAVVVVDLQQCRVRT